MTGFTIVRSLIALSLGSWLTYQFITKPEGNFIIDAFIVVFIMAVCLPLFSWSLYLDYCEYAASGKYVCLLPTFLAITFVIINLGFSMKEHHLKVTPTLIRGFNDGGYNGFSVDFKTDGSYVMENGSGFGITSFFGKYEIKDSIITIDKSSIDNCIRSDKLVIRTENYYEKDSLELLKSNANYITQVDSSGNELNHQFRFRVTEDNRSPHTE